MKRKRKRKVSPERLRTEALVMFGAAGIIAVLGCIPIAAIFFIAGATRLRKFKDAEKAKRTLPET